MPTLVYRHRQHLISLLAVSGGPIRTARRAINGYNLVKWTDNGLTYWAVSDLGASDLVGGRAPAGLTVARTKP